MFSFDPRMPPEKVLVTSGGVQIIVHAEPEPPSSEPPPEPRFPVAIFVPDNQPAEYLDQVFNSLCEQHRDFVVQVLRGRGDVLEESAKDLAQNVMLTLWNYVRQKEPPRNVRGFLRDLIDKEVIDHKRMKGRRPAFDRDADPLEMADSAPDPEQSVDALQHLAKVERGMASLPRWEAEAVRYIELLEKTIEQTARAVGRPLSTVAAQHARGMARLKERVNELDDDEPAPVAVRSYRLGG